MADQLQLPIEFRLVMDNSYLDSLVLAVHLLFKSDNDGDLWKTDFTYAAKQDFIEFPLAAVILLFMYLS